MLDVQLVEGALKVTYLGETYYGDTSDGRIFREARHGNDLESLDRGFSFSNGWEAGVADFRKAVTLLGLAKVAYLGQLETV